MNQGVVLAASGSVGVGLAGFFVILALIVVVVFLLRSMNRHIKNVPPRFEEPPPEDTEESAYPDRPAADREEPRP